MTRAAALLAAAMACLAGAAEPAQPGFLGVQVGPVPEGKGALVLDLLEGGSAGDVGLAKGDVVTSVNGEVVAAPADLMAGIAKLHAGERIVVGFDRAGIAHMNRATLKPRPPETSRSDVTVLAWNPAA